MPSPLRESCSCWKAEKLCSCSCRKCWAMDFRGGNLHNATLFCSNAQKSCNITKSFLLPCNVLWQIVAKTLFFNVICRETTCSKRKTRKNCNSLSQFPKITLHGFSSFHHPNLLPHRKIKPLRKNGYKRTGMRHKFCCLVIPVRLSRECAIFCNGFIYSHTSSAISFTSFNFAHCCSSVNLLPISQEANPHCGLKYKRSSGIYFAAS